MTRNIRHNACQVCDIRCGIGCSVRGECWQTVAGVSVWQGWEISSGGHPAVSLCNGVCVTRAGGSVKWAAEGPPCVHQQRTSRWPISSPVASSGLLSHLSRYPCHQACLPVTSGPQIGGPLATPSLTCQMSKEALPGLCKPSLQPDTSCLKCGHKCPPHHHHSQPQAAG